MRFDSVDTKTVFQSQYWHYLDRLERATERRARPTKMAHSLNSTNGPPTPHSSPGAGSRTNYLHPLTLSGTSRPQVKARAVDTMHRDEVNLVVRAANGLFRGLCYFRFHRLVVW